MITKKDYPISQISWLSYEHCGKISTFYEPESKEELLNLCKELYSQKANFEIIGHTSNIYFLPSFNADIIMSTRRVKEVFVAEDYIEVDCGASVKALALKMVQDGVEGFEGLIDLPGTVAASVYGNASCYGCSINNLLISFDMLRPNGTVVTLKRENLALSKRSSSLKRGELTGIILSVKLERRLGDKNVINAKAEQNHQKRKATQPPAQNNLGSIYRNSSRMTIVGYCLKGIVGLYGFFAQMTGMKRDELTRKKQSLTLSLIGAKDLIPYVYSWNRFIWKDANAHKLFWKFHQKHQLLFKNSDFEIEIKGNK